MQKAPCKKLLVSWVLIQVESELATFDWRQFLDTFGNKPKSTHEEKTCVRRGI